MDQNNIPRVDGGNTMGVPVPTAHSSLISSVASESRPMDIRSANIEGFLTNHWTAELTVTSYAVHRTLSVDNDIFTRSHNESPWKDQGNIVFLCEGEKIVRAHATLLTAILPRFVTDLMQIQKHLSSQTYNTNPQLPVFLKGIEARCVALFLELCNKRIVFMTGREIMALKWMIEVLNIHELTVFVSKPGRNTENTLIVGTGDDTGFLASRRHILAGGGPLRKIVMVPDRKESLPHQRVERKREHTEVKSNSSFDKKIYEGNTVEEIGELKLKKKKAVFSRELREGVLSALKNGAMVRSVSQQFNVDAATVSRWKYMAKKKHSLQTNVAVQNLPTVRVRPNLVERAVDSVIRQSSSAADVDLSAQGKIGCSAVTLSIETPTLGSSFDIGTVQQDVGAVCDNKAAGETTSV